MSRLVKYAGNELTIEDDSLTLQQIRESMSDVFPELQNATPHQEGDIITFEVKAGTKGSRLVKYAGNELTIEDDSLTLQQIRESMSDVFPELQNATPHQEGDIITFEVKAGTKGCVVTFAKALEAVRKLRMVA